MDNAVFVFGGDGENGTVCEKSSVPLEHWTPLSPMHYARSHFTPCAFNNLLYLASTAAGDHRAVESFSPHTETFSVLPEDLQLSWASVAFVANGELTLLTANEQIARWKIESEPYFRVSITDRGCWSLHPLLLLRLWFILPIELDRR